jgi:hypothetical protein
MTHAELEEYVVNERDVVSCSVCGKRQEPGSVVWVVSVKFRPIHYVCFSCMDAGEAGIRG